MPKKTLALISGLVLVTVILFFVALRSGKDQVKAPEPIAAVPTGMQQVSPTVPVHTVLALTANPQTVLPGQQGKVDVNIDTQDNSVTAVQLELSYDPTVVSNVAITPGVLFTNPVVLINKNDAAAGRLTYAFGITPNGQPVLGSGSVATITYTVKGASGKQAEFTLLPSTLVTARGVASSVLKSTSGTSITVGGAGAGTTTEPR